MEGNNLNETAEIQQADSKPTHYKSKNEKIADILIIVSCLIAAWGLITGIKYTTSITDTKLKISNLEAEIEYIDHHSWHKIDELEYDNLILVEQKAVLEWQLENAEKEIEQLKSQLEQSQEDQPQQLPGNIQVVPDEQPSEIEVYKEETEVKPDNTTSKTGNTAKPQNQPSTDNNIVDGDSEKDYTDLDNDGYPDDLPDYLKSSWNSAPDVTPEDQAGRGSVGDGVNSDITFSSGGGIG